MPTQIVIEFDTLRVEFVEEVDSRIRRTPPFSDIVICCLLFLGLNWLSALAEYMQQVHKEEL